MAEFFVVFDFVSGGGYAYGIAAVRENKKLAFIIRVLASMPDDEVAGVT